MSTENTPTTLTPAVTPKAPINFGNSGVKLATLEDAFRFSTAVVKSGLAPKGFGTAEAVLIALQHGAEIGLPPMASLQSIAVINGRPGIYGDSALALVRGSGLCVHHGEAETNDDIDPLFRELQFAMFQKDVEATKKLSKQFTIAQAKIKADTDDFGVTIATAREGGLLEFERFTIADAKKASLWGKEGPWKQYPKRMLKFRARGFKLRDTYGDVLKGLRTIEELQDIPAEKNVTPQQSLGSLIGAEPDASRLQETADAGQRAMQSVISESVAPDAKTEVVEEKAAETVEGKK